MAIFVRKYLPVWAYDKIRASKENEKSRMGATALAVAPIVSNRGMYALKTEKPRFCRADRIGGLVA